MGFLTFRSKQKLDIAGIRNYVSIAIHEKQKYDKEISVSWNRVNLQAVNLNSRKNKFQRVFILKEIKLEN